MYVRYDLTHLKGSSPGDVIGQDGLSSPWKGMWRYRAVLPEVKPVTLGEGWTPMLRSRRYPNVYLKEEGANPTGSFKARGLALAVSMARHYGLHKLAVPSAGNAAGALAAYAAAAGMEAHIFMPHDVPFANYLEALAYGAQITLVDGRSNRAPIGCAGQQSGESLIRCARKIESARSISAAQDILMHPAIIASKAIVMLAAPITQCFRHGDCLLQTEAGLLLA